jgi:hypothetical protein
MDLLSKLFEALSKTVGTPAVILVAAAFIVLQFGDSAVKLFNQNPIPVIAALALFVFGVFLGLVQVLNTRFEVKAGRGFLEGLAAGGVAGLVCGFYYASCPLRGDAPNSAFARTFLLTIIVSSVYGLALSLCDPSAKFRWAERVAAIAVLATVIMLPVALAVGYYAEHWLPGRYISFPEIAVTGGVFITAKAVFPLARAHGGWLSFVVRLLGLGASAALMAWALGRFSGEAAFVDLVWRLKCPEWQIDPLLKFANPSATPVAVLAIALLVVCSSVLYFMATTNNPLTRWLSHDARPRSGERVGQPP